MLHNKVNTRIMPKNFFKIINIYQLVAAVASACPGFKVYRETLLDCSLVSHRVGLK